MEDCGRLEKIASHEHGPQQKKKEAGVRPMFKLNLSVHCRKKKSRLMCQPCQNTRNPQAKNATKCVAGRSNLDPSVGAAVLRDQTPLRSGLEGHSHVLLQRSRRPPHWISVKQRRGTT